MAEEREITITLRGQNLTQDGFDEARRQLLGLDQVARRPKDGLDGLSGSWKSLTSSFLAANVIERGVSALWDLGQQSLASAGNLTDLRASTGASLEALQRWTLVASQGGVDLEKLTDAAFKLGARIANDPTSVRAAVERLGVSFDAMKAMGPEQQFDAIMRAADALGPSQERNAILVELFGQKAAVELAKVAEGYADTADAASVASDAQIEALDRLGDAIDLWQKRGSTAFTMLAGGIAVWADDTLASFDLLLNGQEEFTDAQQAMIADLLGSGEGIAEYLRRVRSARQQDIELTGESVRASATYTESLAEAQRALDGLTEKQRLEIDAAQRLGVATKDIASVVGTTSEVITLYNDQQKAAAEAKREAEAAAKKLTEAKKKEREEMEKLLTAWSHYGRTLEPFTGLLERLETEARDHVTLVSMAREEYGRASAAAQAWAETNAAVLSPSIKQVSATLEEEIPKTTGLFQKVAEDLPNVILQAIQGGGNVLVAAGTYIGSTIGESFAEKYGSMLKDVLPFGLGTAITAMLPLVGGLLGPLLSKIGGFFKNLFGGPDADELAGRELVKKYEDNVIKMLSDTQRMEAGTDRWAQVVVGLRDKLMAVGVGHDEALAMIDRLFKSSQKGAKESEAAIAAIEAALKGQATAATEALSDVERAINRIPTEKRIRIVTEREDEGGGGDGGGYATGTMGVHGNLWRNFGAGTPTNLHGVEAVIPYADRFEAAARILAEAGGGSRAAATPAPSNYFVIDLAGVRQVSEEMFRQIQQRLNSGGLMVPQRVVVAR